MLKSLIVWLMVVAIPFQGFASATMLVCTPMQSVPQLAAMAEASMGHHDHQAMLNADRIDQPHHHAASASANSSLAGSDDPGGAPHHTSAKCNSCATCCFGAAMAPSYALRLSADVPHVAHFLFELDRVASIDLALPERPPQAALT